MKFFVLANPRAGSPTETEVDKADLRTGDITRKCLLCGNGIGCREWLPPHRINIIRHGRRFGDIVIGTGEECFVSENFRHTWLLAGLCGIDSFESVEIANVRPARVSASAPRYWYITPRLVPGAVDLKRSCLVMDGIVKCNHCRYSAIVNAIGGIVLDESTLEGEDLFTPLNLQGIIIVTERFADMVHKHNLTNALLIPVEQYLWDPLHKIVPYSKHKN